MNASSEPGALHGLRVLDLTRHAPGPFAAMMLGDYGADVIQVADPTFHGEHGGSVDAYMKLRGTPADQLSRNKRSIGLNLKSADGLAVYYRLAETADVVIIEWRPGTAERLKADYATLSERNPRLVYCAISGYGQTGPEARRAGHDLNYVARSGVLSLMTDRTGRPIVPANIMADFGGAALAVVAILAALTERLRSGRGQLIDCSLTDATRYLATDLASLAMAGLARPRGGTFVTAGGVPFYDVYETKDGKFLSVAALEERFFQELCTRLGCPQLAPDQWRTERHEEMRETFARIFRTRSQAAWVAELAALDVCFAAVADFSDVVADAGAETGAPRLSRTPARQSRPPVTPAAHSSEILAELGYAEAEIARLRRDASVR